MNGAADYVSTPSSNKLALNLTEFIKKIDRADLTINFYYRF